MPQRKHVLLGLLSACSLAVAILLLSCKNDESGHWTAPADVDRGLVRQQLLGQPAAAAAQRLNEDVSDVAEARPALQEHGHIQPQLQQRKSERAPPSALTTRKTAEPEKLLQRRAAPPAFIHLLVWSRKNSLAAAQGRPDPVYFMHAPVVATVKAALEGLGMNVRVTGREQEASVSRALLRLQRRKITPVLVCLLWHRFPYMKGKGWVVRKPLRDFSALGAYMILFNTEPKQMVLELVVPVVEELGAHEVWDYSHANIEVYKGQVPHNTIVRFMPPGCAQELDVGVNRIAGTRDENVVGFVGLWKQRSLESQGQWNASGMVRAEGGAGQSVNDDASWKAYLEKYPLQLTTHSSFNRVLAFEALRAAVLLTNGACMFSERSHPLDEESWRGIVQFMSPQDANATFRAWLSPSSSSDIGSGATQTVSGCQASSLRDFCSRFEPSNLLRQTGFPCMVEEYQANAHNLVDAVNLNASLSSCKSST